MEEKVKSLMEEAVHMMSLSNADFVRLFNEGITIEKEGEDE